MFFKKSFFIFIFSILVFSFECGGIFFSLDPAERARKHIKLALKEYKKAIKTKPSDVKLIEEYRKILESVIGETKAKVELALLFKEVGLEEESSRLLLELTLSKRVEALKYIEEKIKKAERVKERINLYSLALLLSPSNGLYWFNIGRLYLGLNNVEKGVECLEKAYICQVKEPSLFYYLGNAFIQKGDYEKAEFYLKEGLKVKEDVNLHKLLYTLYKKEGKIEYLVVEVLITRSESLGAIVVTILAITGALLAGGLAAYFTLDKVEKVVKTTENSWVKLLPIAIIIYGVVKLVRG